MAPRVRRAPDPNLLRVHFLKRLRIGNGIRVVALLQRRDDLMSWLALAVAETPIILDQTAYRQLRGEVLGEGVQIHFLERRPAVCHD